MRSSKRSVRLRVQFVDSQEPVPLPDWFLWGIEFGKQLSINRPSLESGLVLVTAPCESPLLGAITLGTLSHLLEMQSCDVGWEKHFETLFNLPVGTLVRRKTQNRTHPRVYKLLANRSREAGIKMRIIKGPKQFKGCTMTLTPHNSLDYVLEDEDNVDHRLLDSLSPFLGASFMEQISTTIPESQSWRNNLDEILISGPTGGNSSPKKQFTTTTLIDLEGEELGLHEVLAVKEWKSAKNYGPYFSRFLNSSATTNEFPTVAKRASFVFYNSVDSYLRFTDKFSTQLQVLVCARDIDSRKTDRLLHKIHSFCERSQKPDAETLSAFSAHPFGMQVHFLGNKKKKEKKW